MTQIPPTTTYEVEAPDKCPECGSDLDLVSPPIGYECRDCMAEYSLDDVDGDAERDAEHSDESGRPETCDATLTSGEICGRERPCPYHD